MVSTSDSNYIKIELPSQENLNNQIFLFKIYGIEQDRPLVRINNLFYQGKWICKKNFVIFTENKTKIFETLLKTKSVFFKKRKRVKIKIIDLNTSIEKKKFDSENSIVCKKLKLYRIPVLIKLN